MLKPEDAEKVLIKNLANVIRKANTGKPLTAAERALIEQAAAGGTQQDSGSAFTKTYDELAQRFGLSRKTLQNASNRYPDAPRARADGRHDVAAWSQFLIAHNIARTAENIAAAPSSDAEEPMRVVDWKARELELKCTKLEIENAKVAGELVDAAEVESGVAVLVGAFRQAVNNFAPRLAGKIVGVKDYHEAEEIILEEVNIVLRTLQRCDFLKLLESGVPALADPIEETRTAAFGREVTVAPTEPSTQDKAKSKGTQRKRPTSTGSRGSFPVSMPPGVSKRKPGGKKGSLSKGVPVATAISKVKRSTKRA